MKSLCEVYIAVKLNVGFPRTVIRTKQLLRSRDVMRSHDVMRTAAVRQEHGVTQNHRLDSITRPISGKLDSITSLSLDKNASNQFRVHIFDYSTVICTCK